MAIYSENTGKSFFPTSTKRHFSVPWRPLLLSALLVPGLLFIELSLRRSAQNVLKNPTHDTRLLRTSYEILRTPGIRVVRITCPEEVLRHSRGLATSMSLTGSIQREGELVKMWAVSRNAKGILLRNDIRYIDPTALPAELKSGLVLPFDPALLTNYLLIPQIIN